MAARTKTAEPTAADTTTTAEAAAPDDTLNESPALKSAAKTPAKTPAKRAVKAPAKTPAAKAAAEKAAADKASAEKAPAKTPAKARRKLEKLSKDAYRRQKVALDGELTRLGLRKSHLELALGDPGVGANFVELRRVTSELADVDAALAAAEDAWLELGERAP